MLKHIKNWSERNAYYLAITATVFVILMSLISFPSLGKSLITVKNSDKFGHILAYFGLSISWLFATRKQITSVKHILGLGFGIISFGIILEGLQEALTDHRTADLFDMGANAIGVVLATLLYAPLRSWLNSMLK